MYFGCSIHGQLDLNEDGLIDLAVGSLGNAVLLWLAASCLAPPLPEAHCNMLTFFGGKLISQQSDPSFHNNDPLPGGAVGFQCYWALEGRQS